jgi:hypothetical protein
VNDYENDPEVLRFMDAIKSRVDKSVDVQLAGFLFYFKECMNDLLADIAVINHELGLLRRELEMEKRLTLGLKGIELPE